MLVILVEFRKLGGGRLMINPAFVAGIDDPWSKATRQDDHVSGGTLIRLAGGGVVHVEHTMGEVANMLGARVGGLGATR